jgi:hypothetical protein
MQFEHHDIQATTIQEDDMIELGPHKVTHVSDGGEEQDIHITIRCLGKVSLKEDEIDDEIDEVDFEDEAGEVFLQFEDGERTLPICADNNLALVGVGIMIAEAYLEGICARKGGSIYNLQPGDVRGPGDMFR